MQAGIRHTASTLPIIGPGEHQKIRQATFIRPAQMGLFARVTCYPPLGQTTSLQRQKELKPEEDNTVCAQGVVLIDLNALEDGVNKKYILICWQGSIYGCD
jgi:hypothetical protein